jgi:hypothetical protein
MSDETPTPDPIEGQDTSVTADTPTGESTQQEVDWAKRYSDLQPEYTRTTQELSTLRQREDAYKALLYSDDPDTRQQAAQALGIELAEDGADDTQYDDPTDALRAELEQLKQTVSGDLTARQQQEQIASLEAAAESSMDTLQVPKDEAVRDWLVSRAVALPPTEHGTLDIEQAWKQFGALMDAQKKTWANTKRTHAFAPGGGEGTQAPDLSTHAGRVQHMLTQLQNGDG